MAAVLRRVHPSELLNCSCERPTNPFGWLRAEGRLSKSCARLLKTGVTGSSRGALENVYVGLLGYHGVR